MVNYRDIGTINNGTMPSIPVNTTRRGQVYEATHVGENLLPYMKRSFISFSFGGKRIEDFDLIATFDNNGMNKLGCADFDDIVTSYDTLDGQYYWSTHYSSNQLDFTLSTDGISQKTLDDFLYWFRAGDTKELILAEHPNRAIMARVSSAPQLNLLPFDLKVEVKIAGTSRTINTVLYKGDILLKLIMDNPHWYSIQNILGVKDEGIYEDTWIDPITHEEIDIATSDDALKIIYEDGVPTASMIEDDMLLGDGTYVSVENDELTYVDGLSSLANNEEANFFYAGTAPAPMILTFTLQPKISQSNYYIVTPKNSLSESVGNHYNTIAITSINTQELNFTTPNIYTSYNKIIQLFIKMIATADAAYTWEDIRTEIRDNVHHSVVRAWANKIIESFVSGNEGEYTDLALVDSSGIKTKFCEYMSYLFTANNETLPATFTFNSETGEATGIIHCRATNSTVPNFNDAGWQYYGLVAETNNGVTTYTANILTEDVGDMLCSNYLTIRDKNYSNSDGKIVKWADETEIGKGYSHKLTHNCDVELLNLALYYRHMYL